MNKDTSKKSIVAKMITLISLMLAAAVILAVWALMNEGGPETGRDISAGILASETGDLTYNDIEREVEALAPDADTLLDIRLLVDPLYKSDKVNVLYIESLAELLQLPDSVYSGILSGRDVTATVSREEFGIIYDNIIETGLIKGVDRESVYVKEIIPSDNYLIVSDGYDEHYFDSYLEGGIEKGSIISVLSKDGVSFKVEGLSQDSFTLRNVYLVVSDGDVCFFLDGDREMYMQIESGVRLVPDRVCSLTFTNDGVIDQDFIPRSMRGKAVAVNDDRIRMEGKPWYSLSEDFRIYDISGDEPTTAQSAARLVGYKEIRALLDLDGVIQAVIIEDKDIAYETIRVLISDSEYDGYVHDTVSLISDAGLRIGTADARLLSENESDDESYEIYNWGDISPEEEAILNPADYPDGTVIRVEPAVEDGRVTVTSLSRGSGAPSYRGIIELVAEDGAFTMVNELPLEEYLYAVVSSELPSSFNIETQKALAVCARGYAYNHIEDGTFAAYGANLDDSIMCQVYNNYPETADSVTAVNDTYSVVMTYDGYVIVSYYFSTSAGVTCSDSEIWGGEGEPYLTDNYETIDKENADLSDETVFRMFMNDSDFPAIEKKMSLYRWNIHYTDDEMRAAIDSVLPERLSKSTDNILLDGGDGKFKYDEDVKTIGNILDIEVTERSAGGVIQEMKITGEEGSLLISGQTNFRNLITPKEVTIETNTGTEITGWTSLPSTVYYVERGEDGFIIHGGGFGHGVGMSQYGAETLARDGYDYRYILMHYYTDIELENIYN